MVDSSRLHQRVLASFVERGRAPSLAELASELAASPDHVATALRGLHADHGLVLHADSTEIWLAHPFSSSPTGVWVEAGERGWWAPCLWCALGIVVLAAPDATIHTRLGGESQPVTIAVAGGERITPKNLVVHFAIPVRHAWDNVVHWCATVQPFHAADEARSWSARHGLPAGDVVPVERVLALARAWYGAYLDPDWHKWTVDEARAIFTRLGLAGPGWDLPGRPRPGPPGEPRTVPRRPTPTWSLKIRAAQSILPGPGTSYIGLRASARTALFHRAWPVAEAR